MCGRNIKLLCLLVVCSAGSLFADNFFELNIRPLMADKCYSCHGDKKQDAGVKLNKAEDFAKVDIKSLQKVLTDGKGPHKISEKEYYFLGEWIKNGARWPQVRITQTTHIKPEDRKYWAYIPLKDPSVPQVKENNWSDHPIDSFVFRKLQENGLTPAEPAKKRALIRRAYFDLVGFPPSPDRFLDKETQKPVSMKLPASVHFELQPEGEKVRIKAFVSTALGE